MSDQVYVKKSRKGLLALIAAVVAALVAGFLLLSGGDDDAKADDDAAAPHAGETIHIVGFAVPEAANKAIAAEFTKTEDGKGVEFKTSYGASGDQSRAVEAGQKADYVHLSVATDVDRLVKAGLVDENWDKGDNKGIVSTSVVVFGVREGNPKNIDRWDDLIKPGVEVVTADPASSGAARWNALAAWGNITENGGTEAEATDYINKLVGNVVKFTGSGRDATNAFLEGTGDVLLAYENEAILAQQKGNGFEYVTPETTLLIENPGAILKDSSPASQSWLDFVLSEDGQRQFALTGFRPVGVLSTADLGKVGLKASDIKGAKDPADPFPAITKLLTLTDNFGGPGWGEVKDKLFGDGLEGKPLGIVTKAIQDSGKGAEKK